MRQKKYLLYDDLRKIGSYCTLKEVYDTGLIKQKLAYFYHKFSDSGCYIHKNICVYSIRDQEARVLFLAHTINRWAGLKSDTFKLNDILTRAVKEITGQSL